MIKFQTLVVVSIGVSVILQIILFKVLSTNYFILTFAPQIIT